MSAIVEISDFVIMTDTREVTGWLMVVVVPSLALEISQQQ